MKTRINPKKALVMVLAIICTATLTPTTQAQCVSTSIGLTASSTAVCKGDTVTLSGTGGVSYSWNNSVVDGQAFNPTATETYVVTGTDTAGCVGQDSIEIEVLPLPNIEIKASNINLCLGDSVQLEAINGQSYTWLNPAGLTNNSYYTPAAVGNEIYRVEGTGANGCINTSQLVVIIKSLPPAPVLDRTSTSTCQGQEFSEIITASNDTGRVFWYRDEALTDLFGQQFSLDPENTTVGTTSYFASTILGGCNGPSARAEVEVLALPQVNAGEDIAVEAGETVTLDGDADTDKGVSIAWTTTSTLDLNDPMSLTPQFIASNDEVLTLVATSVQGCTNSDSLAVTVKQIITISTLLTPNGDGKNDTWQMQPDATRQNCNVQLFDGFGRLIFEAENYQNDWDGTYQGQELPDGDYYYYVQCPGIEEKGTLILIR